jgi:pimeloyl-ACP methyl ester carboxylesterase
MCQARRIADAAPNLVELVEIPGGHCAILEHPEAVNARLRALVESVSAQRRISS